MVISLDYVHPYHQPRRSRFKIFEALFW